MVFAVSTPRRWLLINNRKDRLGGRTSGRRGGVLSNRGHRHKCVQHSLKRVYSATHNQKGPFRALFDYARKLKVLVFLFPTRKELRSEGSQRPLVRGFEDQVMIIGPLIKGMAKAGKEFEMQIRFFPD